MWENSDVNMSENSRRAQYLMQGNINPNVCQNAFVNYVKLFEE